MSISKVIQKRQTMVEETLLSIRDMALIASEREDICDEGKAALRYLNERIVNQLSEIDREAAEATLALLSK